MRGKGEKGVCSRAGKVANSRSNCFVLKKNVVYLLINVLIFIRTCYNQINRK
jgi:hypothetical protein